MSRWPRQPKPNGRLCYCGRPIVRIMPHALYCSDICKRRHDSRAQNQKRKESKCR